MRRSVTRFVPAVVAGLVCLVAIGEPLVADDLSAVSGTEADGSTDPFDLVPGNLDSATAPENVTTTVRMALLLTVVSLVPSVLAMTTCYVRFLVVLGLLRQALGAGQLLSNQVLAALCLFTVVGHPGRQLGGELELARRSSPRQ